MSLQIFNIYLQHYYISNTAKPIKINKQISKNPKQKRMQLDLTPGYQSSSSFYRNPNRITPPSWNYTPIPILRERSRSPKSINRGATTTYINNLNYLNSNSSNFNPESIRKTIDDIYMYPTGFAELLKNQTRNVKSFKLRLNKQKEKIDQDLSSFKIQINHTLEDLRLSLHALLDRIYQCYLDKTAKFKGELFEINRLKDQLQIQLGASSLGQLQSKVKLDTLNIKHKTNTQNPDNLNSNSNNLNTANPQNINNINNKSLQAQTLQTISNMEMGNHQFKKYYILNYIADIQRERVGPLADLQREIVVLNSYQNGFYQSGQFLKVLARLRDVLSGETKRIYQNNYLYIRDPQTIITKDEQSYRILDGLQLNPPPYTFYPVVTANPNLSNSLNLRKSVVLKPQPPTTYINNHQVQNIQNVNQKYDKFYGSKIFGTISPSEQSLKTSSVQNINVVQQPVSIQLPNPYTSQSVLCGTYINNQLALGLKDGVIQILSCDGHSIATLKQHNANICVLAVMRTHNQNYLASGSDVGCCRVILWDPVTWQAKHIFNSHQAAVTGIVDLQDDTHVLSTGYDKRMNIYSIDQGRLVHTAAQTEAPMTALLVNKSGSKLVACGLDKAIYVWQIVRNYKLKAENIILERKIQNNSTISSIVASQILPQLIVITTKDSKIKLVNIDKGQSYKTVSLNNEYENAPGFPIELVIIQRQNKPHYPLALVWPYKQRKIYQVNTDTTLVSIKNLIPLPNSPSSTSTSSPAGLEYGYGVNPKSIFISDSNRGTLIYTVNQRPTNSNCVTVYRSNMKGQEYSQLQ